MPASPRRRRGRFPRRQTSARKPPPGAVLLGDGRRGGAVEADRRRAQEARRRRGRRASDSGQRRGARRRGCADLAPCARSVQRPPAMLSPARWITASSRGSVLGLRRSRARDPTAPTSRRRGSALAATQPNHAMAAGGQERVSADADQAAGAGDGDGETRPRRVARVRREVGAQRVVAIAEQRREPRADDAVARATRPNGAARRRRSRCGPRAPIQAAAGDDSSAIAWRVNPARERALDLLVDEAVRRARQSRWRDTQRTRTARPAPTSVTRVPSSSPPVRCTTRTRSHGGVSRSSAPGPRVPVPERVGRAPACWIDRRSGPSVCPSRARFSVRRGDGFGLSGSSFQPTVASSQFSAVSRVLSCSQ